MKTLLMIISIILLLFLSYFIYLAIKSQTGSPPGLSNQQLKPCPETPNCLCSEYPSDASHFTAPVKLSGDNEITASDDELLQKLERTINNLGGEVQQKQGDYIAATFKTRLFRYVDDFEIRLDRENRLLHIRSASRVGRSDFSANKKRIARFTEALQE